MISSRDESHINRILSTKNYYEVLEVSKSASNDEIHSAYRKLALIIHPDKNNSPRAKDSFIVIQRATAILLDRNKRKEYDQYLSSPSGFCAHKFDISDEEANTILISAGLVGAIGIAAGLYAIYNWFTNSRKKKSSENDTEYAT